MKNKICVGITGASGFVGKALVENFTSNSLFDVRTLCRKEAEMSFGAVAVDDQIEKNFFTGLDTVVHLAANTNPKTKWLDLKRSNVDLTIRTAKKAASYGVRHFIFFSSIGVHGSHSNFNISPTSEIRPHNLYAKSKAVAEKILHETDLGDMILTVLRPPIIYSNANKGNFGKLNRLVLRAPILPFGLALSRRSFCSMENICSATRCLVNNPTTGVFLPADSEDYSTKELVEILAGMHSKRILNLPIAPSTMSFFMRPLGQRALYTSLFEPLFIDRSHWQDWGWSPVGRLEHSLLEPSVIVDQ